MKEHPSISFVLPMFNESENIERTVGTIKSLAATITLDYEIVIVDDASTDTSADIVRTMADRDAAVKLYRLEKNSKFGGAFAEGLRRASKEVIMYSN